MYKWLTLIFLVVAKTSFGQINIQGKIYDKDARTPMPFAFIIKNKSATGSITNEDGFFSMSCAPTDTLTISFVGYQTRKVAVSYFFNDSIFYLQETTNRLESVTVYGKAEVDDYLSILKRAKKKLLVAKPYDSKTYFVLESRHNNTPVELLECYYNAELSNNGIKNLALKNGRIGIAELDRSYFVSLQTTQMIEDFNLLFKNNQSFPFNPLHYSILRLKKLYDIKLVSLSDDVFVLKFDSKNNYGKLFSAKIWVDRKRETFLKIELWDENLIKYPFREIDNQHKMDSLSFKLSFTFDNSDQQTLNKIEFDYNFNYDNTINKRRINSTGVFLFYDKNEKFDLPFNAFVNSTLSDYDKIVSQPYNAWFWDNNEVLIPSKKVVETKQFFQENGVLLNYSKLAPFNPLFQTNIVSWNSARLRLKDLNGDQKYELSPEKLKNSDNVVRKSDLFEFVCAIFLDRNVLGDSTTYTASTLIGLDKSFYYLKTNRFTDCLINIVFDIVEIENRKMKNCLNAQSWSNVQVDSIYNVANETARRNVLEFIKVTGHGKVEPKMVEYITEIDLELGVNNVGLIRTDSSAFEDSLRDYYVTEISNIGNALLDLGKYSIALNVLKIGEDYADVNPWIYYNMGVCYYNLGKKDLACRNFKKAKTNGDNTAAPYADVCK